MILLELNLPLMTLHSLRQSGSTNQIREPGLLKLPKNQLAVVLKKTVLNIDMMGKFLRQSNYSARKETDLLQLCNWCLYCFRYHYFITTTDLGVNGRSLYFGKSIIY